MKAYIRPAIYITLCSIFFGISFNYFRADGISLIAKPIDGFSSNLYDTEFVIEIIDLEIAQKLFYAKVPFIDARDSISFNEGHINNAIPQTPYNEMIDRIIIMQGFNGPIVVYCDDEECGQSEDLAYQLQTAGFSKIYVFSGGWNQWSNAKLPIEK